MKIDNLSNGQVVRLRMGRYVEGLAQPAWGAWRRLPLLVQKDNAGRVCSMTVDTEPEWASYDPRHEPPVDGVLLCEDYYLEIDGLAHGDECECSTCLNAV